MIFDVLLFAIGFYLIISDIQMKKTGILPKMLQSDAVKLDHAKDKKGYMDFLYKYSMIFGIVIIVFSCINLCCYFINIPKIIQYANYAAIIGMTVFYCLSCLKAQKKYII